MEGNARAVKDIGTVPCSWHRISSGFSTQGGSSAVESRYNRYLPLNCVWSHDIMGRTSPGLRDKGWKGARPSPPRIRGSVRSGNAQLLLHLNIGSDACAAEPLVVGNTPAE